jgi:hypothetical protein
MEQGPGQHDKDGDLPEQVEQSLSPDAGDSGRREQHQLQ